MPQDVAMVVYGVVILALFLFDRDRESQVSRALWIPIAWVSISASRMVSEWFAVAPAVESLDQDLEGSPLDALILAGLLAAGLIVLFKRRRRVGTFLRANGPLLVFFLYCAVSVLWSDYPFVAFKRWTKAVGNLVMVLVVLTDPDPSAAVKRLLARSGFLLIPFSVLLIKYYPALGQRYNPWTGWAYYSGVATGKNGLGYVCLVFGLASVWRVLEALRGSEGRRRAGQLIAHGVVLAMALWLFWKADSATSLGCFLIGVTLMAVMSLPGFARRPTTMHLLVAAVLFLSLSALFLDGMGLVEAMGRDATLTGRTALWDQVLSLSAHPLFGTGFESFWLGERVEKLWRIYWWHPNQAHNGYLEIFLNLGWIGLALLGLVMAQGYRNVVGVFRRDPGAGRLRLAYFVVAALYNLTEAAFKGTHPVGIAFLLAATAVPEASSREAD